MDHFALVQFISSEYKTFIERWEISDEVIEKKAKELFNQIYTELREDSDTYVFKYSLELVLPFAKSIRTDSRKGLSNLQEAFFEDRKAMNNKNFSICRQIDKMVKDRLTEGYEIPIKEIEQAKKFTSIRKFESSEFYREWGNGYWY